VQEAERRALVGRQRLPVVTYRFEQAERADHVGLDERPRPVDGAIYVALCSEVQHRVGFVLRQQTGDQRAVANIAFHEDVVRVAIETGQGFQVAGIGQGIKIDDLHAASRCFEDEITADESGAAGDKPSGHYMFSRYGCAAVPPRPSAQP
jgi:hypothetical protein